MRTLKELNGKAWYRLLKVLYFFLYLPCLLVLYGAYEAGRNYHSPVYPNTIVEALNDPEFYKVSDYEKRYALEKIDNDFDSLDYTKKNLFIEKIDKINIKTKEIKKRVWVDVTEQIKKMPDEQLMDAYLRSKRQPQVQAGAETDYEKTIKAGGVPIEEINTEFTVVPRKTPLPQKGAEQKYFYVSYYTRDILKTIGYLLIAMLCYVLFMEIIRRIFYYVVTGKLFPKE